MLDLLVSITRQQDNYEQCLRWATEKADYCRQLGKETEALRTEAEIGVILVELGEEEKGIAKLNGVIASLEGQRQTDEMDACVIAIRRKINVLKKLNRVEEVIPLSQHLIEMINDYREHYNQYTDNEMRLIHGAKLLIEHPDMSISDVATDSGFASNITFAHNFKERYAISPSNFREEKRAQLA